jgi:hypothetical protein
MKSPQTHRVEISNNPENSSSSSSSSSSSFFLHLTLYAAVTGAAYPQISRGFLCHSEKYRVITSKYAIYVLF